MSRYRRNGSGGTQEAAPKNKPIYSRKHWVGSGNVEVAVFEKVVNEGKQNEFTTFFVSAKKTYKTEDGKYEETTAYNPHELLVLAEAVKDAYAFVVAEQNRE